MKFDVKIYIIFLKIMLFCIILELINLKYFKFGIWI